MDKTANHLKYMAIISLVGSTLTACNDSFMKASPRSKTSALAALSATVDEAGNISAAFDPNSSTTQVLKFNTGTLAGSAIAIPPGALTLPVSITVGEGETLTSTQFLQNLGITNNNVTAAGPSVSFVPSQAVEASNPFTLSIPLTITSLALTGSNENIVIMYRWTKVVNGEATYSMGIIPGEDVLISSNKVSFQTTKFGVFQVGKAETKITERVNVATIEPPALKKDAGNPLVGSWGMCETRDNKTGDNYSEPIFSSPTWGQVSTFAPTAYNSNVANTHFAIRGKSGPLSVSKYSGGDCTAANSTPITTQGYVASDAAAPSVTSYMITDSQSTSVSSSCLTVFPKPDALPMVKVNQVSIVKGTDPGTPSWQVSANWDGNVGYYKLLTYPNESCTGTSNEAYHGAAMSASFSTPSLDTVTSLVVQGFSDSASLTSIVESACVIAPRTTTANQSGVSIQSLTIHSFMQAAVSLSWETNAVTNESYNVESHGSANCSDAAPTILNDTPQGTGNFYFTAPTTVRYYRIKKTSNPTSVSACILAPVISNKKFFNLERYRIGATWADLRWMSINVKNSDLKLEQFSALECQGAATNVVLNTTSGFQDQSQAFINNLVANTKYSFKLSLASDPSKAQCQNIMTTNKDIRDWSGGNANISPQNVISFKTKTNVTNTTDYKLKVSIDGDIPVDSYSFIIPKFSDSSELIRIETSDANGKILTFWTPSGCYFKSTDMRESRFNSLSWGGEIAGGYVPEVICDGSSENGGGGSDSFGAVPGMVTFSKRMNLKITNGAFTMIEDLFQSPNCSLSTRLSSRIELGSLVLPGQDSVADTYPVDVTTKDLSGIIFSDAAVTAANTYPDRFGCGIKGWVKEKAQSISSSNCADIGKTGYYRLKVVGGDKLYLCESQGKDNVYGETAATRVPSCDATADSSYFKRE